MFDWTNRSEDPSFYLFEKEIWGDAPRKLKILIIGGVKSINNAVSVKFCIYLCLFVLLY